MKKTFIYIVSAGIVFLGAGCGKGFLSSLQDNPNSPSTGSVTPSLILPGTISTLAGILNSDGTSSSYEAQGVWLGYWNYSAGYSFNSSVQNYVMTNTGPELWDNYYGDLSNLEVIIQKATPGANLDNYGAIANILSAICFENLVDLYNDIPYTQALQGSANFFPGYDKGSDIYDSLTARLDNAITTIQTAATNTAETVPANDDILFGGNMNQWLVFANSVKLRLLVRESNVTAKQSYITSEIAKTASVGFLTSDALANPGYTAAQPSPMYGQFGVSPSGSVNGGYTFLKGNATAMNFYKSTDDPRLGYFYAVNQYLPTNPNFYTVTIPEDPQDYSANVVGIQNSLPNGGSGLGPGIIQAPNQSSVIMAASDSYFNQAEAVVRGYLTVGNAQTLYQNGITASFEYLGVGGSTAAADSYAAAYYGQTGVTNVSWPAGTDNQIVTILEQKWAALNGIANAESYADWRRTFEQLGAPANSGIPVVPVSISPSKPSNVLHMPFRYYYPQEEQTSNLAAFTAEGGGSIDPFNSKIFWMP
jgi:hypothetical protein